MAIALRCVVQEQMEGRPSNQEKQVALTYTLYEQDMKPGCMRLHDGPKDGRSELPVCPSIKSIEPIFSSSFRNESCTVGACMHGR